MVVPRKPVRSRPTKSDKITNSNTTAYPGDAIDTTGSTDLPYSYFAYGLTLRSRLALPELSTVSPSAAPDVTIERCNLTPVPEEVTSEATLLGRFHGNTVHYVWRDYGQFLLRGGREVHYCPLPGAPEDTVRAPLLGVVLGTILHQRGIYTLHASAVSVENGAVAFIGQKGAGKSTTAAALHQRGHRLLTDDVMAVEFTEQGTFVVQPAFPRIKLQPDALSALGHEPTALPRLHNNLDKRIYSADRNFQPGATPLRRIYVLSWGDTCRSSQLSLTDGLVQLLSHAYAARFLGADAAGEKHFRQSQAIVQQVPVHRLERPSDLDRLSDFLEFIESDLSDLA